VGGGSTSASSESEVEPGRTGARRAVAMARTAAGSGRRCGASSARATIDPARCGRDAATILASPRNIFTISSNFLGRVQFETKVEFPFNQVPVQNWDFASWRKVVELTTKNPRTGKKKTKTQNQTKPNKNRQTLGWRMSNAVAVCWSPPALGALVLNAASLGLVLAGTTLGTWAVLDPADSQTGQVCYGPYSRTVATPATTSDTSDTSVTAMVWDEDGPRWAEVPGIAVLAVLAAAAATGLVALVLGAWGLLFFFFFFLQFICFFPA
jgi:hypothetical protein